VRCAVLIYHGEGADPDSHGINYQGVAFIVAHGIAIPGRRYGPGEIVFRHMRVVQRGVRSRELPPPQICDPSPSLSVVSISRIISGVNSSVSRDQLRLWPRPRNCATSGSRRRRFRRGLRVSSPTIARPCAVNARPSGGAATRREIIEPRNRKGFVTEQIR
jgi:hypothetical protein